MCLHLKRRVMFPRLFLKVTDDMRLYFRKDLHVSIVHHVKFTVSVGVCVCSQGGRQQKGANAMEWIRLNKVKWGHGEKSGGLGRGQSLSYAPDSAVSFLTCAVKSCFLLSCMGIMMTFSELVTTFPVIKL